MAKELGVNIRTTSGPVLERPGDLVGMLTSLGAGDILFIDEVHRLRPCSRSSSIRRWRTTVWTSGSPTGRTRRRSHGAGAVHADRRHDPVRPADAAHARAVRPGRAARLLSTRRPGQDHRRSAGILDVPTDAAGIAEIARRSRGTPRVANRLLKRVRDYAQVRAGGKITAQVAAEALNGST